MHRKEAIEKYGSIPCYFIYYNKYVFEYLGIDKETGIKIMGYIGDGTADDIYRWDVSPNQAEYVGGFDRFVIIDINNETEICYYDNNP